VTETFPPQDKAPPADRDYATWAPGSKDAVGTALGSSRLWFTVAQGIVTEVYYPRPDIPQLKDLGFIVADNAGFWTEVRRLDDYDVRWLDDAIPAITVTHRHARFSLVIRLCADSIRDVLLVDFSLQGDSALRLYVLAAPRLGGDSATGRAWADLWVGQRVLWAEQGPFGLAIAAVDRNGEPALLERSVGCAGVSDGWHDFQRHAGMRWHYAQAGPGSLALTARLTRSGTLALGVSTSREAAATLALQSLANGFAAAWMSCAAGWNAWLQAIRWPAALPSLLSTESQCLLRRSAVVIKCHEDRTFPGAYVASLSVPWGESSTSRGGYHLVWARDLVETAGALVALGCLADAQRIMVYLIGTQQADGHWLQNQWLGGKPFWEGIQLDETAFPVLLASSLAENDALGDVRVAEMVRRALGFIAREGPVTGQDRWEEDTGVNTFTIAVAIAALVEGSRFLEPRASECALMLADTWNSRLEEWTWAADTALARALGVPGYYMRNAPLEVMSRGAAKHARLAVRNHSEHFDPAADEQLAIDCLQLARYGLRSADDPKMTASIRAIDALLQSETPNGPVWHRYNGDGYGEHPDGAPFDGWGKGRGWPLLTGERGHFALLAQQDVRPYVDAMTRMSGKGGLLPEQVWDSDPIAQRGLYPGQPNGAAMPLVWAHAEFIKLALSYALGTPVDRPPRTAARYQGQRPRLDYTLWLLRMRTPLLPAGQELRILLNEPAQVHWGTNGWLDSRDMPTEDLSLGHLARVPTAALAPGETVNFTFYWPMLGTWEGEDFEITVS
jgi:glucoamylase